MSDLDLRIWPDMDQRSEAWFRARAGRPTASQFSRIITPAGKESAQAKAYAIELLAESRHPEQVQTGFYGNEHTERGTVLEPEALDAFREKLPSPMQVVEAGFVTRADEIVGCSPDGLVRNVETGEWVAGVEIKCPLAKNHLATVLDGKIPDQHLPQVHGSMAVTGLRCWYFVSYHPGEPLFAQRIERNAYTKKVEAALDRFVIYYAELRKKAGERLNTKDRSPRPRG